MNVQRLTLQGRNAIGLNKLDASRMHITEKLHEALPVSCYEIKKGNKTIKYTVGDDFVKVDTFIQRRVMGPKVQTTKIYGQMNPEGK